MVRRYCQNRHHLFVFTPLVRDSRGSDRANSLAHDAEFVLTSSPFQSVAASAESINLECDPLETNGLEYFKGGLDTFVLL